MNSISQLTDNNIYCQRQFFQKYQKKGQKIVDSSDESDNNQSNAYTTQCRKLDSFSDFNHLDFYYREIHDSTQKLNQNQQIQQILKLNQKFRSNFITKNNIAKHNISNNQSQQALNTNQLKQLQLQQQQLEIQQKQYKKQFLRLSQKYHKNAIQKIQLKLFQSKVFSKSCNFTNELQILRINPTKNYQIVQIQMQLLSYQTSIKILNQLQSSDLHKCQVLAAGGFGKVYLVCFQFQKYAVKCIQYKNIQITKFHQVQQKIRQFKQILKQIFFIKLFSQLQIGPKIITIMGFDLISTKYCIQFCTEICQKPDFQTDQVKNSLRQCLITMHSLKIVHRDIKPDNAMYSQTYKKTVFIDFGTCMVLKQPIGLKSISSFAGTTEFCTGQMLKLLCKQQNYIDLYYNDLYGLMRTIEPVCINKRNKLQIVNQETQISMINTLILHLNRLKYYFYSQNQQEIQRCWRMLKIHFFDQIVFIQQELLYFFMQLKPYDVLRRFFNNCFSAQIKQKRQFSFLRQRLFESRQYQIYDWNLFSKRLNIFETEQQIYKSLQLNKSHKHKHLSIDQNQQNSMFKQIFYLLINKKIMTNYIKQTLLNKQSQIIQMSNLIVICTALVHYCCLNKNQYQIDIKNKIQACQRIITIIEVNFISVSHFLTLNFKCQHQKLKPIAKLYQFFNQAVWNFLPTQFKQNCMTNSVLTLCLLGYPKYLPEARSALISKFIKNQSYGNKIIYFWKCNLIMINVELINFNQDKSNFISSDQEEQQQIQLEQQNLFKKQNRTSSFVQLNRYYYQNIYLQNNNFIDDQQFKYNQTKLQVQWHQNCQISKNKFQKWKQLLKLYLSVIYCKFSINNSIKQKKFQSNQTANKINIADIQFDLILQLLFSSYFKVVLIQFIEILINNIDRNIDFQSISLRYFTHYRILIAFKYNKLSQLIKIIKLIVLQINLPLFQTINIVNRCLQTILSYIGLNQKQLYHNQAILQKYIQIIEPLIIRAIQLVQQISQLNQQKFKQISQLNQLKCKNINATKINLHQIDYINKSQQQHQMINKISNQISNQISKDNTLKQQNLVNTIDQFQQQQYIKSQTQLKIGLNKCLSILITISQLYYTYERNIKRQIKPQQRIRLNDQFIYKYSIKKQQVIRRLKLAIQIIQDNKILKPFIERSMAIRNGIILFSLYNSKHNFCKIVDKYFPNFTIDQLKSYDYKIMPSLFIIPQYLQQKQTQHNVLFQTQGSHIQLLQGYINFWNCLQKVECIEAAFQKSILQHIFRSYIILGKDFDLIQAFFIKFTIYSTLQTCITIFTNTFQQLFSKGQIPKLNQNDQILTGNIKSRNFYQDRYMSLVYFFCLKNQQVSQRAKKKFLSFIFKSFSFINPFIRKIIMQSIYYHKNCLFKYFRKCEQFIQKQQFLEKTRKKILLRQLIQFGKSEQIKKQFYYLEKHLKLSNPTNNMQLYKIVQKRFLFRKLYLFQWDLPQIIENLYNQKLTKYYLAKQNFK